MMLPKDIDFKTLLEITQDREKSLEKNFIFQTMLFLISFIYLRLDKVGNQTTVKALESFPEILKPIFSTPSIINIVMPLLLTYYFIRMGHYLDSYLYLRKLTYDNIVRNWPEETTYKFSDIYSSLTNSTFFESINLLVLSSNNLYNRKITSKKLYKIYAAGLVFILSINHTLSFYFITNGFTCINLYRFITSFFFAVILFLCYKVFMDSLKIYSTRAKWLLSFYVIIFITMTSFIILKIIQK